MRCPDMTSHVDSGPATAQRSARWTLFFRALFSTGAAFRFIRARRPMRPVEELLVRGRRSGIERSALVQLIDVDGRTYVAEPSGLGSAWADNLASAGRATIV